MAEKRKGQGIRSPGFSKGSGCRGRTRVNAGGRQRPPGRATRQAPRVQAALPKNHLRPLPLSTTPASFPSARSIAWCLGCGTGRSIRSAW